MNLRHNPILLSVARVTGRIVTAFVRNDSSIFIARRSVGAFFLVGAFLLAFAGARTAEAAPVSAKGLWITCIGQSNVLSNKASVTAAVQFAKDRGFTDLFVQVYRGDEAWFDSTLANPRPFVTHQASTGIDTFAFLIEEAHRSGLNVHAWLNTLTLSKKEDAKILKASGPGILTLDQHGKSAIGKDDNKKSYLREDQLFLEPGDWRVRAHVIGLARELAERYPRLDGLHFDYIRYPAAPPFIPGSRFNDVGLSYGYGPANVKRFMDVTGIDAQKSLSRKNARIWDDWKRDRVTTLLEDAAKEVKSINPRLQISCAVLASVDRAYFSAYQNWPDWVDSGLVDFVVLMAYTEDPSVLSYWSRSALSVVQDPRRIYVGLGAFLLTDTPEDLRKQVEDTSALRPGGIVYFDYDTLLQNPALAE